MQRVSLFYVSLSNKCAFLVLLLFSVWADADTWFERQQQEKEMLKIQAENKAAMETAEELHRKKLAQDRQGEMDEDTEIKEDPMARAEADALSHDNA